MALLLLVVLAAGCGGGDDDADGGEVTTPVTECQDVEAPEPREPGTNEAPSGTLVEPHALVFDTNCGTFTVALDLQSAPETAASLVALAESGYFDDTVFHRVVPGFVIQGGDPTQTGSGGPGYSTVDAPASDAKYTKGVVAMAKSGAEGPGTSGSQFFVVSGEDAGLPPDYAIVGAVTEGIDTVERIDALGVGDGPPSQTVVVNSVTATQTG
ncbi:MAG TPA: peptidylprolyl isomerase [Gaiellaceae bacterium]|nr:peptidylprolyl isomerase [Gaiellaceae bacterium]